MVSKIAGKEMNRIGFGLLSLNLPRETPITVDDKVAMIKAAVDSGANFLNGAEFYGPNLQDNSLTLLNKYFEKYPEDADKLIISIKGGLREGHKPDNSPEYTRESIEHCLSQLGDKGKIDAWAMARRVTQEDYIKSLRVIDSFVKAGKIGGVALSEVNAKSIRQAAKIVKVVAVEVEMSLFNTDPLDDGIVEACSELDIPILAYSPLGRSFLTGAIQKPEDLYALFQRMPRFHPDNWEQNMKLVEALKGWATKRGCTPAQLSINWLAELSDRPSMPKILPIPGAASLARIKENIHEVKLSSADMTEIDRFLKQFTVQGERVPEFMRTWLDTNDTTEVTA
ncbi:NADP-dependent oxidoreductase domain-containing protein [Xylariaceae sp. FL1019]|nr:NADP-dependent oxidoreductase domain-containing protein [Xylariaceae sp. FL1019]